MTNASINLEKRIKKHVQGKAHSFFISTLPGFEQVCLNELSRIGIPSSDAEISKGGILFTGRVHDCYLANLYLRTANRILMRLFSFTASNFRQLEKKLAGLPWELYLHHADCRLHVTSRHSRLVHTDAIAERFKNTMGKRMDLMQNAVEKRDVSGKRVQQIFVRTENDRFTVSIDSTGELLHKRGLKIQGGKAPVRETIAAAILSFAGYQPGDLLIDPMCGTGTFSLEAAMITNNIPAGWYRDFAFMAWPGFQPSRWKHIRREAEKRITQAAEPVIFASDRDAGNSEKLKKIVIKYNLSNTIKVFETNFFDLKLQRIAREIKGLSANKPPGLIVLNPPYGRRLESKKSVKNIFTEAGKKLKKDFKGWHAAILVPDKPLVKKFPFKTRTHELFHGGLKITLVTGKII